MTRKSGYRFFEKVMLKPKKCAGSHEKLSLCPLIHPNSVQYSLGMQDAAAWLAFGLNRRHKLLNSLRNITAWPAMREAHRPLGECHQNLIFETP